MTAPYAGGCQCGAVRYEIRAEPLTLYVCHCTECQKQSAGAFGMSLRVPSEAFAIVEGAPRVFERTADSGNLMECAFCPDCGTRLFHKHKGPGPTVTVKPGSLDDRSWLRPVAHIYMRSAQPWVTIPDGVPRFETIPDDPATLAALWRERHG